MSQLDEQAIVRLLQVAEEQDLAFLRVRVGRGELAIARVPPSELDMVDLSAPDRGRPTEPVERAEAQRTHEPQPPPATAPRPPGTTTPAGVAPGETISAPMVGAFYRAPAPGQPPFVELGSSIEVGDTVGLVEAMKVFTAVPATCAGVVVEILVENGAFVEFGQPLVRVEAAQDGAGAGAPHG